MYQLSICAIAKNEQFGLREWVAYHRVVGVEHFYIYDNDSQIPVRETLSKETAAGYVSCIEFPGPSKQMPAYNHCLAHVGGDSQWMAFIDCDEFLVPKKVDTVPEMLSQHPARHVGGLQVNWIIFGSSNHILRPSGLVIEDYTFSSPPSWKENLHTKAIVQPQFVLRAGSNPHYFVYKTGYFAVGEDAQVVPNAWSKVHCAEQLQLNHYTIKSLEDFRVKMAKGRADAVHLPTANMDNFDNTNGNCTERDTSIQRFIGPTKRLLESV